jgi:hypothetical protein
LEAVQAVREASVQKAGSKLNFARSDGGQARVLITPGWKRR